jgi:hypothetical protein
MSNRVTKRGMWSSLWRNYKTCPHVPDYLAFIELKPFGECRASSKELFEEGKIKSVIDRWYP